MPHSAAVPPHALTHSSSSESARAELYVGYSCPPPRCPNIERGSPNTPPKSSCLRTVLKPILEAGGGSVEGSPQSTGGEAQSTGYTFFGVLPYSSTVSRRNKKKRKEKHFVHFLYSYPPFLGFIVSRHTQQCFRSSIRISSGVQGRPERHREAAARLLCERTQTS